MTQRLTISLNEPRLHPQDRARPCMTDDADGSLKGPKRPRSIPNLPRMRWPKIETFARMVPSYALVAASSPTTRALSP
jgi:hypothetical protein